MDLGVCDVAGEWTWGFDDGDSLRHGLLPFWHLESLLSFYRI